MGDTFYSLLIYSIAQSSEVGDPTGNRTLMPNDTSSNHGTAQDGKKVHMEGATYPDIATLNEIALPQ